MPRPKDPDLAGKTERIDTRVSPETRAGLEKAAAASGVSLSREIEERLVRSLNADGAQGEGCRPETEGLLCALRAVIEEVEGLTGQQWQADGFTRDGVADAVSWLVRFLGPDSGPPPPTFPTGFEWATGQLRLENARQFIDYGVGRHCAEKTIRAMAAPFPKTHSLASFAAEMWWFERNAARPLKGLIRVRTEDKIGEGKHE